MLAPVDPEGLTPWGTDRKPVSFQSARLVREKEGPMSFRQKYAQFSPQRKWLCGLYLVSFVLMAISVFTLNLGVPQILMMPSVTSMLIQSPKSNEPPTNRIWIPALGCTLSVLAFWTHAFVFKSTPAALVLDGAALILGFGMIVAGVKLAKFEASAEGQAAKIAKTEGSR